MTAPVRRLVLRVALPTGLVLVAIAEIVAEIVREYRRTLTFPNVTHSEDR